MIGKTISHYKILEKIGGGGMGVVYKAEDTRLKRTVALKFLPQDLTRNPTAKQRFVREAQNASLLDHPNISNIHEIDETADGQLFISMTYYEGETLQKKIERGPMQIEQAIAITIQVAQGLFKAHSKKIIHRDIKPGNIFITEDGQVKILDFGLAKLVGETKLTRDGTTTGTIAYMSPEQAQGKDVSKETDIWSLGVVFYEMLTGSVPFKGENWRVTLYSILNTKPESIRQLRDEVPEALVNVVDQMMQKDTRTRYRDTTTLIADLCSVARESNLSIPQAIVREPTGTKNLTKVLIPSLILVLLAIAFLFTKNKLLPTAAAAHHKDIAVVAFKNLTGESDLDYLTVAIPNLLTTSLEETEQVSVVTWERMYDLAEKEGIEVELIDEETGFKLCRAEGIQTIVLGSFTKAGEVFATDAKVMDVRTKKLLKSATSKGKGIASIINTQIDELSASISIGIGVPEAVVRETQSRISDVTTSSMEAYTYFLKGREYYEKLYFHDALPHFEKAIELDSTFAVSYLYLAWTQASLVEYTTVDEYFEKAKRFSEKTTEKERLYIEASYASYIENNFEKRSRILNQIAQKYPQEKRVHKSLGNFYRRQWLFDEAIAAFNKSLDIDPNYGEALTGLAYTYTDMKEYSKAISYFKKYAAIFPDDANTFDSMADLHFFMGNLAEAIASYKKALEIRPIFFTSAFKLSYMYALKEDYNAALKWCDYCIAKAVSPGIAGTGYSFRSFLDYWLGDFNQWQTDFRKMTELYEAAEHKWAVYGMELVKGAIYYELGDFKRSRNSFETSLDSININEPLYAAWRIAYWNSVLGMVDLQEEQLESVRTRMSAIASLIPKVLISGRDWLAFRRGLLYTELLLRVDSLDKAIDVYKNNAHQPPEVNQPAMILANIILPRDVLARVYQRMGKLDKAIAEYERLITYDIPNGDWHLIKPEYHYRLAQLYGQKGKNEKAINEYKKVVDIWKNTDMYADELEKAKERLRILTNNTL